MKSLKNTLILLLAVTTVGGFILAWRQYGELVELRAAAMNKSERADLQKRVWDLEKLNRDFRDRLAARSPGEAAGGEVATTEGDRAGRGDASLRGMGRGGRLDPRREAEQQFTAVRELLNRPEVQALVSQQQKTAIDARYAALFKNLNLAPDQADRLKALLAERTTTMQDVMSASFDQGINPRENPEAFRKLMTDAQNEINKSIRSVIGDQGFAQLSTYEQTLPQRNLVNDLQQRLSYTSSPLTSSQAEQLVQILAANPPPRTPGTTADSGNAARLSPGVPGGGRGGPPGGFDVGGGMAPSRGPDVGGMIANVVGGAAFGMNAGPFDAVTRGGGGAPVVTPAAVTQSQSVLSPPQVAALQQIQQQQQTQQQLRQLVNETLAPYRPAPPGSDSGVAPVAPPPAKGGSRGGG